MARICLALAVALGLAGCADHDEPRGPFGACDTSATNGSCTEYLQQDNYAQSYCTGGMGGAWVAACPTANRIASCRWPSSIQYWYTNYTGSLSEVEYQCSLYGKEWTTY